MSHSVMVLYSPDGAVLVLQCHPMQHIILFQNVHTPFGEYVHPIYLSQIQVRVRSDSFSWQNVIIIYTDFHGFICLNMKPLQHADLSVNL